MSVTANGRSPGADVVDILILIDIPNICAFDAIEHDRLSADGFKCPHGRTHTPRHQLLSLCKNFFRLTGFESRVNQNILLKLSVNKGFTSYASRDTILVEIGDSSTQMNP